MKYLLFTCILLMVACSNPQQKSAEEKNHLVKPLTSAFIIPVMRLMPVNADTALEYLEASNNGKLSAVYKGKFFPDLNNVEFNADYLQGFINASKTINGLTLSKQLIDTPLKITHFATDDNGEIYIVTQQEKIYQFVP